MSEQDTCEECGKPRPSDSAHGLCPACLPGQAMAARPVSRAAATVMLWVVLGYFLLSAITLPFLDHLWLGELPVLALIQLPKVALANWLRVHVVMEAIRAGGWSAGSFSPDYILARPYALALVYLPPMAAFASVALGAGAGFRRLALVLIGVAVLDYVLTLWLAGGPGLTIY